MQHPVWGMVKAVGKVKEEGGKEGGGRKGGVTGVAGGKGDGGRLAGAAEQQED